MFDYDSLLLWLEPMRNTFVCEITKVSYDEQTEKIKLPNYMKYNLNEPNALLLDKAEYRLDDGSWQPKEEILRLDNACRKKIGWLLRNSGVAQPWTLRKSR